MSGSRVGRSRRIRSRTRSAGDRRRELSRVGPAQGDAVLVERPAHHLAVAVVVPAQLGVAVVDVEPRPADGRGVAEVGEQGVGALQVVGPLPLAAGQLGPQVADRLLAPLRSAARAAPPGSRSRSARRRRRARRSRRGTSRPGPDRTSPGCAPRSRRGGRFELGVRRRPGHGSRNGVRRVDAEDLHVGGEEARAPRARGPDPRSEGWPSTSARNWVAVNSPPTM